MEYRGVEYAVVQTIRNEWRWSVKREHGEKVGTTVDRETAIKRAKRFINELIKKRAS
jgi:hypothetical protein